MSLYSLFVEPWTAGDWMWRGVLTASLVAVSCALLGCFLVLRRMSLFSDALAHVALPGLVGAYLLTGSTGTVAMFLGAIAAALLTTGLVSGVKRYGGAHGDAAIGIVFTALFALGVIMLSAFASDADLDTSCVLFGDVLGVADHSIITLAVLCVVLLASVIAFFRPLQLATFDPAHARAVGLPVAWIFGGMMAALSVTTVASFEAVGAVLVIAAMITPAATAHLLTRHLQTMLAVAVAHGLISAVVGMYVSIWLNCSTGGAMVCVGAVLFGLAMAWTHLARALRRPTLTAPDPASFSSPPTLESP